MFLKLGFLIGVLLKNYPIDSPTMGQKSPIKTTIAPYGAGVGITGRIVGRLQLTVITVVLT